MSKKVILTGIRANNDLHIGNYFGALLPLIDLARTKSDSYDVNLFIPDLHSFTTPIDHTSLQQNILSALRTFVAAGLPTDNPDIRIYRQSYVSAHSELTWILDCFTSYGEMNRMTQFKDKAAKLSDDRISVGLFNYPVLMAADVLLYSANYVPVGDDQSQHLEFIRDLAERFNKQFGDIFVVPESVKVQHQFFNHDQGLRIKDLVSPNKKMSKSEASSKGIIFLNDNPEMAAKKVLGATTDSEGVINYDPIKQSGIANLLQILALLSGQDQGTVNKQWVGQKNYSQFKQAVASQVKAFLTNFQHQLASVSDEQIMDKLRSDELTNNQIANKTLLSVQRAVGLRL